MKILLTNFHDGDGGGHTTYLMALARGLRGSHEIHVAAPPTSRLYREASTLDGVRVVAQPFPNGASRLIAALHARRRLRAYLREQQFGIIHVNGSADHRMVLSACRNLPRRPKIVLTKHNSKIMRGFTHRHRAKHTDLVIAVSDATMRDVEASPYAQCRLLSIRNGVDTMYFQPWSAEACAAERARWCGEDALLLGSNAGTAAHKGWMDLIDALALLPPEQRSRVHVLLCGKPPTAEQMQHIGSLELAGQIHFAGLLNDVRPMIAAIDAGFVLSYAVETISFACREMMAMAKPVLVTDYAGLPENISDGVDGWITPVRCRDAIAARVARMLDTRSKQRDHLRLMGDAARAKAEREFGLARFVEATEAAYVSLVSKPADLDG